MWAEAGFDPDSFWNQTPRRLDAILTGYVRRRKIEHEQSISLAWHIENFARAKKLPSLNKVLGRPSPKSTVVQSEDEMLTALRVWAAVANEGQAL